VSDVIDPSYTADRANGWIDQNIENEPCYFIWDLNYLSLTTTSTVDLLLLLHVSAYTHALHLANSSHTIHSISIGADTHSDIAESRWCESLSDHWAWAHVLLWWLDRARVPEVVCWRAVTVASKS